MAKYTIQVRTICENAAGLDHHVDVDDIEEVLDNSWDKIFDQDIYENLTFRQYYGREEYYEDFALGETICKNILREFYTREIGAETVGLWKLWMNSRLSENGAYISQLYGGQIQNLYVSHRDDNMDVRHIKTEHTYGQDYDKYTQGDHSGSDVLNRSHVITDTDSHDNTNTNSNMRLYSDTPQGDWDLIDGTPNPNPTKLYATDGTQSNGGGTDDVDSTTNGTKVDTDSSSYTARVTRYKTKSINGATDNKDSYSLDGKLVSEMIKENAEYFIDADNEIYDMFRDLFLNLY